MERIGTGMCPSVIQCNEVMHGVCVCVCVCVCDVIKMAAEKHVVTQGTAATGISWGVLHVSCYLVDYPSLVDWAVLDCLH